MIHKWIELKLFDPDTRRYKYFLQLDADADMKTRMEAANLLDIPLFYEEKGGLGIGIIGSLTAVAIFSIVNELAKQKTKLTAKTLLTGWTVIKAEFMDVLAAEFVGKQAKVAFDQLVAQMRSYAVLDLKPDQLPRRDNNGDVVIGERRVPLQSKPALLGKHEFYEHGGRTFRQDQYGELMSILRAEHILAVYGKKSDPR